MEILNHLNDEKPVNLQHSRFEKMLQPSEAKIKEMKPRKGGPQNFQNFGKMLQVQQKAYRIYFPVFKKIDISRDVTFDEGSA